MPPDRKAQVNSGSFRDPTGRIYGVDNRILRGISAEAHAAFRDLSVQPFYRGAVDDKRIVATTDVSQEKSLAVEAVQADGWSGVLDHDRIPFISYPYEWPHSMLQDAALLQLDLVAEAMRSGWTMKDATPFNVQWLGPRPAFIDVLSYEKAEPGQPWVGYRQFCSMFLIPLMLRAYGGIDHLSLLRGSLEGIEPIEAARLFRGSMRFRRGVPSHVLFPAAMERRVLQRERDTAMSRPRKGRPLSEAMILGLIESLQRLVGRLDYSIGHTAWSHYDRVNTYEDAELAAKKDFVARAAGARAAEWIWDIGCNTGVFSRLCSDHARHILAVDADHDAVEQLYRSERERPGSNILPLVMNLSNPSPGQGWAGRERLAFEQRGRPDLVLSLALIHHMRLSANVPVPMFLDWLRGLGGRVVLEFVDRDDPMVVKLLTNKRERYEDYNRSSFLEAVRQRFRIEDSLPLREGKRELFLLNPAGAT